MHIFKNLIFHSCTILNKSIDIMRISYMILKFLTIYQYFDHGTKQSSFRAFMIQNIKSTFIILATTHSILNHDLHHMQYITSKLESTSIAYIIANHNGINLSNYILSCMIKTSPHLYFIHNFTSSQEELNGWWDKYFTNTWNCIKNYIISVSYIHITTWRNINKNSW